MGDYTLTLEEVSKRLGRSKKTVSRYVKKGLLSPIETQSDKNTLIYKFSEKDLENFKSGQGGQDKKRSEDKTGHKQNTSRVNNLHRGQGRQDKEDMTQGTGGTNRLVDILDRQLTAQNAQIADMQKTINDLTATVNKNSETLKIYSVKLLALTEGKTGQNIEDIQDIEEVDTTKEGGTSEVIIDTDTQETPLEETKEAGTEQTQDTEDTTGGTDKTGQEGTQETTQETPQKKSFWQRLFE